MPISIMMAHIGKSSASLNKNIVQTFKIPSGAMTPTLIPKDRLLVDKSAYKNSVPKRGDIIVFKFPDDTARDFIKRVIGLPGESLEIREGKVLINGREQTDSNKISTINYYNKGPKALPGTAVNIPEGNYFVMGDNSQSSHDSRYWGFVPAENILGKAYKIYYPFARSGPIE